jgi:hypothetical protein
MNFAKKISNTKERGSTFRLCEVLLLCCCRKGGDMLLPLSTFGDSETRPWAGVADFLTRVT